MIYVCYGITKTASTFLYQLTEEILRAAGRRRGRLRPPLRASMSVDNYLDIVNGDVLDTIEGLMPDCDVVLKTHGPLDPTVVARIEAGSLLANASIRDPREIALSMLDHGLRSRRWRYREFSEHVTATDTFASLDSQLIRFREWASVAPVFTYNEICYDTARVVSAVANQIGVSVDPKAVLAPFARKGGVGQFSKGAALRYREMPEVDQQAFLARYASLYADYTFDTPQAEEEARRQASMSFRARGQIAQLTTHLRRYLRG